MESFPLILEGIDDLSVEQIKSLMLKAQEYKVKYLNPLSLTTPSSSFIHSTISTIFLENSTRTQSSFIKAAQNLGMKFLPFDAHKSSLAKGEDLEETFLTLESLGVNILIYRTNVDHQLSTLSKDFPIPVINAGDGMNEHPTQALTDLYTFLEEGIKLSQSTISIIGDIKHSRVTNSLIKVLKKFDAKIILVTHPELIPEQFLNDDKISVTQNLDEAILQSDLIYTLRIQKERHASAKLKKFFDHFDEEYGISLERLKSLNKEIPVYHPGPINLGVELSKDIVKSNLYRGYRQVRNGVFVRMAIIKAMVKDNLSYKKYHWENIYEKANKARLFTF